jgi:hypothetical protein
MKETEVGPPGFATTNNSLSLPRVPAIIRWAVDELTPTWPPWPRAMTERGSDHDIGAAQRERMGMR